MTYLADASMLARLQQPARIDRRWVDVVQAGLVGVCPVVEAELMRGAKSKANRDQLRGMGLPRWVAGLG